MGEVYLNEGLEDALNIDRNSFRESDILYIKLQEYLFSLLGGEKGITKDVRKRSKVRMDKKRKSEEKSFYKKIENIIMKKLGKKFKIQKSSEKTDIPVSLYKEEKIIKLFESSLFPRKKKERNILEIVFILYEVSRTYAKDKNELTELFYGLLNEIKW